MVVALCRRAGLDLAEKEAIELTPTRVVHAPEVTHVRYSIDGPPLARDDRGSGKARQEAAGG